MKKVLGILLACMLLMTTFSAFAQEQKIEITFWHNWGSGPSGDSITASVDAYNAQSDKYAVKALYVAQDGGDSITSKMLTAVAGGQPPEVMLASRYGIAEYMDGVTIMNDLVARDGVDTSIFYPWALDEASFDGRLLGLPYDGTSRALFYNKDHFAAAGLDPESPPTNLEELMEYGRKLTISDGNRISQFGFVPWMGNSYLYTWGWSFGGEFMDRETGFVTPNDPKIVAALAWMTDYAKEFGIDNVLGFSSSAGTDVNDPFTTGQLSMVVQGNWFVGQLATYAPELNYGICNIPSAEGVDATTFVGGRALIIPRGIEGEKLEAAWDFVKWMCTSEEGQSMKAISNEYPAVREICEKLYADNEAMQKFLAVLPNGKNRPVVLAGNMLWDELVKTPELVLNNQGTPQEILDDITERVNQEIEIKMSELE